MLSPRLLLVVLLVATHASSEAIYNVPFQTDNFHCCTINANAWTWNTGSAGGPQQPAPSIIPGYDVLILGDPTLQTSVFLRMQSVAGAIIPPSVDYMLEIMMLSTLAFAETNVYLGATQIFGGGLQTYFTLLSGARVNLQLTPSVMHKFNIKSEGPTVSLFVDDVFITASNVTARPITLTFGPLTIAPVTPQQWSCFRIEYVKTFTPHTTTTQPTSSPGGTPVGAIVGAVVGGVVGLLVIILLACFLVSRRRKSKGSTATETPARYSLFFSFQQTHHYFVVSNPPARHRRPLGMLQFVLVVLISFSFFFQDC